ncbi:hypothetical protein AYO41_02865 [Verrucomicrobia bacterium SCGC AG-212-E04]|nr:hypothetical protein AYO41_02865 [Verrucomicrobia bacterium SCGC AG-212-E04]
MKKYRRLQAALTALVVGTFALGMVSAVRPSGEIFPFASWFLFSLVPQRVTSYEIRVHSWGDQKFEPAKPLIEIDGLVRSPQSSLVFQLVQRFGRAVEAGNATERDNAWRLLQARFSNSAPVRYDLIKLSYDPMERARGEVVEHTVIAATESGTKQP